MTGYGKARFVLENQPYIVEIKSLNSKQMDLFVRMPQRFRDRELAIRSLLALRLEHGKVDFTILEDTQTASNTFTPINREALNYYLAELMAVAEANNLQTDLLQVAMRMPDVLKTNDNSSLTEGQQAELDTAIEAAIDALQAFREQEGMALENMFEEKLSGIEQLLAEVEPLEKQRIEIIRERILNGLEQLKQDLGRQIDENRLEQEMIFYLEKLDITEEKVRLRNHIRYFRETMANTENKSVGKKLGFIAQEMGREINTLGSKSNFAEMQIIVVKMKDLLEQIKEQVLNVL